MILGNVILLFEKWRDRISRWGRVDVFQFSSLQFTPDFLVLRSPPSADGVGLASDCWYMDMIGKK
jgi:hypothetical protein